MPRPPRLSRASARLLATVLLTLSPTVATCQRSDAALRRMTAELLPRVEALSGLKAIRPLNVASRSREELHARLLEDLSDEQARRETRMWDRVYHLLGLVPESLDLVDSSLDLYGEQIAGYYDPRRDTLYVLNDLDEESVITTLVHEMVHAIQGQHVPLDSLLNASGGGDRASAARSAVEGHAEMVEIYFMLEEIAAATGRTVPIPDFSRAPFERFFEDSPRPMLLAAPPIVRDGMVFPYIRGAGFVQALWRRDRSAVPFHDRMPVSTEQVMDPDGRFFDQRDQPVGIAILPAPEQAVPLGAEPTAWTVEYESTLGQFELSILLRERHTSMGSEKFALGWAGDRYQLLNDGAQDILLWYIVWDDSRSAYNFANAYRQILSRRLNRSGWVEELTVDGRSVVRVIEAARPIDSFRLPRPDVRLEG